MNYKKIRENRKRRENIEIVKVRLSNYGKNLKLIDEIKAEIVEKRDRIDMLRCGWSDSDPTNGGGTSQEEKIISILDEIEFLEDEIKKFDLVMRKFLMLLLSLMIICCNLLFLGFGFMISIVISMILLGGLL